MAAQAGDNVSNVRVVSQPLPPRQLSWPPQGLIIAASIFAGIKTLADLANAGTQAITASVLVANTGSV